MRRWTAEGLLELGFHCQACLLCKASASVMVSALSGLALDSAAVLVRLVQTTFPASGRDLPPNISGDLIALYDLRRYPTRAQCVLLPWDAITKLLYN
jgi:nitrogen fixation NifU-like protein